MIKLSPLINLLPFWFSRKHASVEKCSHISTFRSSPGLKISSGRCQMSELHVQAFVRGPSGLINLLRTDQVNVRFHSHVEIYVNTPTPYNGHYNLKWAFKAENGEWSFLSGSLTSTTGVWTTGRLVAMETAPLQHTNGWRRCADKHSANHRLLSWDALCVSRAPVWRTPPAKCLWLASSCTFKFPPSLKSSPFLQLFSLTLRKAEQEWRIEKQRWPVRSTPRALLFGLKTIQLLKYEYLQEV